MWSPLGSSAMGSTTLRSSLSENSIPLLLYKNKLRERSPNSSFSEAIEEEEEEFDRKKSRSSSGSSGSSRGSHSSDSPTGTEDRKSRPSTPADDQAPPRAPPRIKRHARTQATTPEDHNARTLTPGSDPGASRPLGKGRCVSMPSVVSTPVTPRHRNLLLVQQQHQHLSGGPFVHQAKTSGSHHRRFLRRFPAVDTKEALVNHYSCALVADILLQGILYVGERHFAFYSNIFGHKKRLLIKAHDVVKVTKERTAKIIPNAVGIATAQDKYVFGSLMSRDATFKAMHQVWIKCIDLQRSEDDEDVEEETSSHSELGVSAPPVLQDRTRCLPSLVLGAPPAKAPDSPGSGPQTNGAAKAASNSSKVEEVCVYLSKLPKTSLLLLTSTLLLVALFASASVLVYRIAIVQKQLHGVAASGPDVRLYPELPAHKWKTFQELSRRQNKVLIEEVGKLTTRLQEHVRHLHQMRLPLEELAATASKLPDFCTSSPTVSTKGQQPPHQQTHRNNHQQDQQQQWATFVAA